MNKILIVAHPSASYQEVERLLNDCGMGPALPSRREGLTPEEIGSAILKGNGVSPLAHVDAQSPLQQVAAGPIWHGLALDLMLGNLDQALWGWSDPQAVHLLEYWKALDPGIAFILIYDSPRNLLTRSAAADEDLTPEILDQRVCQWCAYNAALLHFFHRNTDRSLLVHAQQVGRSTSRYLQQVRVRVGAPLDAPAGLLTEMKGEGDAPAEQGVAFSAAQPEGGGLIQGRTPDALKAYLTRALLGPYSAAEQCYEELQSVANLPLDERGLAEVSAFDAWRGMAGLEGQALDLQKALTQLRSDGQQCIAGLEQSVSTLEQSLAGARHESEVLLAQLHQVQDQLESRYVEGLRQGERLKTLEAFEQLAIERLAQTEEARRQLATQSRLIDEQTGALESLRHTEALAAERQKQIEDLDQGLLGQMRLAAERQRQIEDLDQGLRGQTRLAAERQQQIKELDRRLLGQTRLAAERQKQIEDLNQQMLGQTRLAAERQKQIEGLDQDLLAQKRLAAQQAQQLRDAVATPPLRPALEQENERLLAQLHQIQKELERHYLENLSLRSAARPPAPAPALAPAPASVRKAKPQHFGAANRIKQQLTYRLGATMIAHSRSVGGVLSMPLALTREVRQFRLEKAQQVGKQKLPPISQYSDAHQAERVKQHLSYRLGAALLANGRSPLGWLKLPFALHHEVKQFRERQGHKP